MMKDDKKMLLQKIDESLVDDGEAEAAAENGAAVNDISSNEDNNGDHENSIEEEDEEDTASTTSFCINSEYVYEYYDDEESEMDELLERVNKLTFNGSAFVQEGDSNNNDARQSCNESDDASGDAQNGGKLYQAQLVRIRIRPQYIEYLRTKHGWSAMCKFKPKVSQQYIQRSRYLLSSPPVNPPPLPPSSSSQQ